MRLLWNPTGQPTSQWMIQFDCASCQETRLRPGDGLFHDIIPNERVVLGTTATIAR